MTVNKLNIVISEKLKNSFAAMCKEREISMSDAARELIADSVRNYNRRNGKTTKDDIAIDLKSGN